MALTLLKAAAICLDSKGKGRGPAQGRDTLEVSDPSPCETSCATVVWCALGTGRMDFALEQRV